MSPEKKAVKSSHALEKVSEPEIWVPDYTSLQTPIYGAPNDGSIQNTLKTLFRLSRVL